MAHGTWCVIIFWILHTVLSEVSHENPLVHDQSVIINCFFENKLPGPVNWQLNGISVTDGCRVNIQGLGILEPTVYCNGTNDPGAAYYQFNITQLDCERDANSWQCFAGGDEENLPMNITVINTTLTFNGAGGDYRPGEVVTAEVITGCNKPLLPLIWCVESSKTKKCSDESNWWEDYFEEDPVKTSITSCQFCDTESITSTFNGKVQGCEEEELDLFVVSNNEEHFKGDIKLLIATANSGTVLAILVIIIGSVSTGLGIGIPVYHVKGKKDYEELKIPYIVAAGVLVFSLALSIAGVVITQDPCSESWMLVVCCIFLVLNIATVVPSVVVYFMMDKEEEMKSTTETTPRMDLPDVHIETVQNPRKLPQNPRYR